MTFAQFFEEAFKKVDTTAKYEGRNEAMDAVVYSIIKPMWGEIVKDSKWETGYADTPYGEYYAQLSVFAHQCKHIIRFKIKLTQVGKRSTWEGYRSLYRPSYAFTVDEDLMNMDIIDYLNKTYDNNSGIAENIALEYRHNELRKKYKSVVDDYNKAVEAFNDLPLEVRQLFRYDIDATDCYHTDEEVAELKKKKEEEGLV